MTRSQVWAELRKRGIAKAEVGFHGGNDEGNCDGVVLFDANGAEVLKLDEYYANTCEYDPATKTYKDVGPPNADERLSEGLCVPVYDQYGSFAGEYSVSGTVTWDVKAGTVSISGEESVEQYDSFEREV